MWSSIKKWFKGSETIAWARIQAFLGGAANLLTIADPQLVAAVIPPEYVQTLAVYMLLNGIASEYLRRRRDPEMQ